jgi:hypothetical protein
MEAKSETNVQKAKSKSFIFRGQKQNQKSGVIRR